MKRYLTFLNQGSQILNCQGYGPDWLPKQGILFSTLFSHFVYVQQNGEMASRKPQNAGRFSNGFHPYIRNDTGIIPEKKKISGGKKRFYDRPGDIIYSHSVDRKQTFF